MGRKDGGVSACDVIAAAPRLIVVLCCVGDWCEISGVGMGRWPYAPWPATHPSPYERLRAGALFIPRWRAQRMTVCFASLRVTLVGLLWSGLQVGEGSQQSTADLRASGSAGLLYACWRALVT